jgi:single-stranded-DNA-specific exonuclease
MAAGLRLASDRFEDFRQAFCAHALRVLEPEQLMRVLTLDCLSELRHITGALVSDLRRLGPFGHANPRPVLCCRNLEIALPPRRVGKTGDHLQITVRQAGASMKCIAFGYGSMLPQLSPGTRIDLAAEPTLNEFNGRISVELEVKGIEVIPPKA